MTTQLAKQIILDLLDAGQDSALVQCQDGGDDVDVVFSRLPGHENTVMTLAEAERRTDKAIRAAWLALTGDRLPSRTDPVGWVNS